MPKLLLSFVFIFLTSYMWSQENLQEKLEIRKAKIQQEILDNEKQLQTVKKQEKTAVNVIVLQTNKIQLKENLIHTTEIQTKLLSNDMYINQVQVNKLKKELELLKEDYAKMILKSYKSRSEQSRAMFILSSDSFLQAYKRAQYMKQYTSYRKAQGEEIQYKTAQLSRFYDKLDVQKTQKQILISQNEKERLSLESEKIEQQKLVDSIKKDKNKITKDIQKKQQETRNIDKQIDRLIRQAIAEANRKAAVEKAAKEKAARDKILRDKAAAEKLAADRAAAEKARAIENSRTKTVENAKIKTKPAPVVKEITPVKENPKTTVAIAPVSSTKIDLTSEGQVVSDNFRANKGRLPWPVEKGFISLGYGDQAHPVYKTLVIHNSGLEITTDSGSSARAVFSGEVTTVIVLSPVNKAVMIQHGDFFTVYQNLSSVNVSKGDKVSIKQSLGKIRTNAEGKTILKFMLSQNTTYTNPKSWLSGR